jgi:hypothetical protein
VAGKVWVVRVKPRADKLRMSTILGKDDRFTEPVAVRNLDAMCHQVALVDDFYDPNKPPHIAISVDMLDTGIDVS